MADRPLENDERVREQERADREDVQHSRPRREPPDEPASNRTPSLNQVLHRAEALAAVSPPTDTPPVAINDTNKINSMARMGGDVPVFGGEGLDGAGPTLVGKDIGKQVEEVLDSFDEITVERRR